MPKVQRNITVQIDSGESRTETFLGRDYLVVPVVAMVEGVRFGANQSEPELGLAAEFGDQPILWANRPLVLNHPQIDGVFVSANSPEVLTDYFMGLTMNPVLDGSKLKMEAWIDVARCQEMGGDFQDVLDRIGAGETIEVSVGFFSDLEQRKGKFNGQAYGAIWRHIRPDHLAILSAGIIGACSVKDGCGMPRINADQTQSQPGAGAELHVNCSCQDGGEDNPVTVNETDDKIEVVINKYPKKKKGSVPEVKPNAAEATTTATEEEQHRTRTQVLVDQYLSTQKVDPAVFSNDVSRLLSLALRKTYGSGVYLYGYTNDVAVFEVYDFDLGYTMKQIGINVSADSVEFVGDAKDVVLLTRIVPQESNMPNETKTKAQEGASPEATTQSTQPNPNPAPTTPPNPAPNPQPTPPQPAAQEQKKPLSVQEYIAQAPEGMRDVLAASLKVHEEKKATAIKALKDSKQCKFTDEYLTAQSLETLENMVALLPGTFQGVASPSNPTVQGGNLNTQTVPVTKVFGPKPAAAA